MIKFCRALTPCGLIASRSWNYFYTNAISVPVEVTAATILLTFWDADQGHQAGYTAVIAVLVCAINIFGVRWFGESEFIFSIIKRGCPSSFLPIVVSF